MDKAQVLSHIEEYLQSKGWTKSLTCKKTTYEKNYSPQAPQTRSFITTEKVYETVKKKLEAEVGAQTHFNTVINPYKDTDFIIAALQCINPYVYDGIEPDIGIKYSFQPVVRPIPEDEIGNEGFLKSFVNVGTVGILKDYDEFFVQLELWLDILALCRIHISRVQLELKTSTSAYDGVGLSVNVNGYDIGQANVYEMLLQDSGYYVLDFGFGLERISWAANSFKEFDLVTQNYSLYYLQTPTVTDSVKYTVLLMLSGVIPSSKKFGLILRNEMVDLFEKQGYLFDYTRYIDMAYDYYSKFIFSPLNKAQIVDIFEREKNYLLKKTIAAKHGYVKNVSDIDIEKLCKLIHTSK